MKSIPLSHPASLPLKATLQALFVTLLWSTSWVLIKIGLKDIPAVLFAGLRYGLAFMVLLPIALRLQPKMFARLSASDWLRLTGLGLIYYSVTQGAQFVGLQYLPAATFSLMLSFSTVLVAFFGILWLKESPTWNQWLGIGLFAVGACFYFYPVAAQSSLTGWLVAGAGVIANAISSIMGRSINRSAALSPITITTVSMGIGAAGLLVGGFAFQEMPILKLTGWLIVVWLAVINSALAFTLWNRSLQTLSAVESSTINNTMLIQIAILAWVFLGEALGAKEIAGLLLAMGGTILVQVRSKSPNAKT